MPASQVSVNLFGGELSANSPWNRIVTWISTYGRYILITTELIVLLAFLSRFSLDRKLTDLKEEITQKQQILEVNAPLENKVRSTQTQLAAVKTLLSAQDIPVKSLRALHILLPTGVYLNTLSIDKTKVSAEITAATTQGLSQFLSNLHATKKFSGIEIGNINKQPTGTVLTLTAFYADDIKTNTKTQ